MAFPRYGFSSASSGLRPSLIRSESQGFYLSEGLGAVRIIAIVGLLAGVDSEVLLERGVLGEVLPTFNQWATRINFEEDGLPFIA